MTIVALGIVHNICVLGPSRQETLQVRPSSPVLQFCILDLAAMTLREHLQDPRGSKYPIGTLAVEYGIFCSMV